LNRFRHYREDTARKVGLALQQQALLLITGDPGKEQVTVRELAERIQICHHGALSLVNLLEERGLAESIHNIEELRQVNCKLTEKGTIVFESMASLHCEEHTI
jgi:DNA-binding MarR family transcriptional regulator